MSKYTPGPWFWPYKLKYKIEPGRFAKPDKPVDFGLTDEILLCSYLQGDDGSGNYLWLSSNGEKGAKGMAWGRQIHCLLMLAKKLADEAPGDCPNQKILLNQFFDIYKQAIRGRREEEK